MSESRKCAECGAVLDASATREGLCPRCLLSLALIVPDGQIDAVAPGQAVGPYRLVELVGEGGMGLVYLAEQEVPIRRKVALKIIKRGMDTREVLARFDAERQALAMMEHANIARVYDAGSTNDGRPYFVMEYLEGTPVTDYCDRHCIAVRRRLELFVQICDAVHHAHQKGVLHRDLKPSNILVVEADGKAVPKIIDFGLAKALDRKAGFGTTVTHCGVLLGTPEYMSPEQLTGGEPVDTRTDVYSLGLLLYELLTGVLPYDAKRLREAGVEELCRVVCRLDPPKPSRRLVGLGVAGVRIAEARGVDVAGLARSLRGELEWILLKSLEKKPSRRYGSASEFATDIVCHLEDEPVSAGPQHASYRVGKFVRKHWTVATATVAVIVCLAAVAVVSTILYRRAERTRAVAVREQYVAAISAAAFHISEGDPDEARRLLSACDPSLRGWEWRHLMYRADPTVRVWDTGALLGKAALQPSFALSGSSRSFFWSTGTSIEIWEEGGALRSLGAGLGTVLALQPGGERAAIRSSTGGFGIYRLRPLLQLASLDGGAGNSVSAAFDSTGHHLAVGDAEGRLQVWDVARAHPQFGIRAHAGRVTGLGFWASTRSVVSAGEDGAIRIWDDRTGKLRSTVTEGLSRPWLFDLEPSIGWIIYSARDGDLPDRNSRVRVQSLTTSKVPRNYPCQDEIGGLAFNHAIPGYQYAFVSRSGELQLCDEAMGCVPLRRSTNEPLDSVAFSPDGATVYTGSDTGRVCAWDAHTRGGTYLPLPNGEVRGMAISPIADRVIVAQGYHLDDCCVFSGIWYGRWPAHAAVINEVAVARDGSLYASASDDRTARIWSRDGRPMQTLSGHTARVNSIAFGADNSTVATASDDRSVRTWDARSGDAQRVLLHAGVVSSVRFSPDGAFLLTGSTGDGAVALWDARTGEPVRSYQFARGRPAAPISAVGFSPDGSRVVAARESDGVIGVWNTRTARLLSVLSGHSGVPLSLAFSPDGSRLASGSVDRTVRIWDMGSFEQLLVLRGATRAVRTVAFARDGTRLLAAAGGVYQWPTREGMRWPNRERPKSPSPGTKPREAELNQ